MYMYIYTWMCRMLIVGASVYDIYKYTYRSVCVYIQVHMYMYIYTWMCRMLIQGASVYDNLFFIFFIFYFIYIYMDVQDAHRGGICRIFSKVIVLVSVLCEAL